ncbi:flagellar hook-length control protein FliK [Streptomyces boninensis]|uniref:flagellar hook-length control protein FliK n=1 Tax=Streptomyces boninensis TaxID=2039455 RepID=UPI003B21910D
MKFTKLKRKQRPAPRTARALRAAALALALVGTSAAVGVATDVAAPAKAYAIDPSKGTPGYCPDADGVTVIIDFQELGGDTIIRCAPGDQATGLTALKNAGIQIQGTDRWGEAFICRIEGKPGADTEPCRDTPPASAYWSYWHAPNAGTWTYSQYGVMNRKPPLGSFEGWSFSKDKTAETNPPPRIEPTRP